MATVTPNYNWPVPTSTDLVKDGATAIESLGDSIDATTKSLNPATTLGDIQYRSSVADTNTRLGIGTTGQVLTVSGGVPAWASPAAGGGMTLLSTTTLSGTVTTVSSISQSYKSLYAVLFGVKTNTNTQDIWFAPASLYAYGTQIISVGNGTSVTSYSRNAQQITDGSTYLAAAAGTNYWAINITNYTSTTSYKTLEFSGIYESKSVIGSLAYPNTGAISSISVRSLETFNAGTLLLYGVN